MKQHHERSCMPNPQRKASSYAGDTTTVVTICIRGKHFYSAAKAKQRLKLLWRLVRELAERRQWTDIDVILLPGGYLRRKKPLLAKSPKRRLRAIGDSRLGRNLDLISRSLQKVHPGITLVCGIDTPPLNAQLGGDEIVAAWRNGELIAVARKAFPASGDTDGKIPIYVVSLDDVDDPQRLITLKNNRRALLLGCYDAFGVRAVADARYYHSSTIRWVFDAEGRVQKSTAPIRDAHMRRWQAFLKCHPPDLALASIHRFKAPGRDCYWQRHGIAGASSALQGAAVLGAAHFSRELPDRITASPLAAVDVPANHLEQGPHRKAHPFNPIDGFTLQDDQGRDCALIRLFVISHERNIS